MSGRKKVAVLDLGFIPIYWGRFYDILNARSDYEYVVFHGEPPKGTGWLNAPGPFDFPNKDIVNHTIPVFGWRMVFQPVIREIMTGGYDAIIMCHELKFVSNLILLPLCKLRGIKIIYWGFGYHANVGLNHNEKAMPLQAKIAGGMKDRLAKLADGFLAYTQKGAERMQSLGLSPEKTWVVSQTIDVEQQIGFYDEAQKRSDSDIRAQYGLKPDSVVLMFVGRLVEAKRVDLLLEAVRKINRLIDQPVQALIVGEGRVLDDLKAQDAGPDGAVFTGKITDQQALAELMKVSAAIVIPGYAGITVTHGFAQGTPVITRDGDAHSPEFDYLEHGVNALITPQDEETFIKAVSAFCGDQELQQQLAEGALKSRDKLSLTHMAAQFDGCAHAVLGEPLKQEAMSVQP